MWLAFWLRWYWIPARHPRVTAEERELIEAPVQQTAKVRVRWRELFGFRQTWALFLARVVADPVWWFYLFWLPKYLADERGFTMVEIGLVAWMPYLTADLGSIAGGWASGRLVKRGASVVTARKWIMLPSAAVMPLGLLVAHTSSSVVAVAVICLITCAHMSWKTNLMTMTNDIYPTSVVGSVAGIVGLGSSLGGVIFTRITGVRGRQLLLCDHLLLDGLSASDRPGHRARVDQEGHRLGSRGAARLDGSRCLLRNTERGRN